VIRIRAKRSVLKIEGVFTGTFEGTALLVGSIALVVILAVFLVNVGMKSFKIAQENEWLRGRIETLRMEKESLQSKISEMVSEFEVLKPDGR